ncbi:DUF2905 domain-containing protein [Paenibacillus methanolicus]|uniref:DUF2905 family protein n=1 Tax=Paenibacillus methanolicus TaxID=582686 RepID=A0A5S5BR94_9BACL|nr:DUF2905 domain-containing protein [Paenibacillus methanolicus]TYP68670.1 Protein of unknown function (DUF2905) [Paenibacillus methanolicus]
MGTIPKLLILAGAALIVIGLLWALLGRFLPLGRLPGDIAIEKEGFAFYFPVVTCIVISLVVSGIAYLVRLFK